MGFSLKKAVGKAISIGTGGLISGSDISGTPATAGSSSTTAPNISYLVNNKLQSPDYSSLINLSKTGSSTGTAPSYTYLTTPIDATNNRSSYYNNLMSQINAPSSVDSVREGIYGEQYQNLLSATDKATNEAMGSGIGGYYRRGLIDPNSGGISSDIASVGLANIAAQGATTKSNAALTLQQNLLDLQKARETASIDAAKLGYTTEANADTTATTLNNSNQQLYSNLMNSQEDRAASAAQLYANLLQQGVSTQNARDIAYATQTNSTSTGGTAATPSFGQNLISGFGSGLGQSLGR
jgi:hypothetical protein